MTHAEIMQALLNGERLTAPGYWSGDEYVFLAVDGMLYHGDGSRAFMCFIDDAVSVAPELVHAYPHGKSEHAGDEPATQDP